MRYEGIYFDLRHGPDGRPETGDGGTWRLRDGEKESIELINLSTNQETP